MTPLQSPLMPPAHPAANAGIGLRQPHYDDLLERLPSLGFVEVHSENFFAAGGAACAVLREVRKTYPVSLHGVGLALGSAAGVDTWHLDQLAALVERIDPVRVSDHACFARVPMYPGDTPLHANDLLPIAFTESSLAILADNIQQVQDRLKRPLLVENLTAYLRWSDDAMAEPDFFNALTQRTGCGLLLDLNNLVVNALNERKNPVVSACAWVNRINPASVGEIHLAGHKNLGDIVIDDHGSRVHESVWQVYRHAIERLGTVPTLVEWDTELPALDLLIGEARHANRIAQAAQALSAEVAGS